MSLHRPPSPEYCIRFSLLSLLPLSPSGLGLQAGLIPNGRWQTLSIIRIVPVYLRRLENLVYSVLSLSSEVAVVPFFTPPWHLRVARTSLRPLVQCIDVLRALRKIYSIFPLPSGSAGLETARNRSKRTVVALPPAHQRCRLAIQESPLFLTEIRAS